MAAYSRVALIPAAVLLSAAHKPAKPSGELLLDAANPVVQVELAGVPLRLRVDLNRQESVELNPAAAARLPVKWEPGMPIEIGRIRLDSRIALAELTIYGRTAPTQVAEHGRDCCAGVDGAIGPDLLSYATVRWHRPEAPAATARLSFPISVSPMAGLSVPADTPQVRLHFAFDQAETVGTAAAGAVLSNAWGGRWDGAPGHATLAFGVVRPARTIAFARPGLLAGFAFPSLRVRISDFAGDERLPADPAHAGDIVVSQRLKRQHVWNAVIIGTDRLSRCIDITYDAIARSLTLACAFDGP